MFLHTWFALKTDTKRDACKNKFLLRNKVEPLLERTRVDTADAAKTREEQRGDSREGGKKCASADSRL